MRPLKHWVGSHFWWPSSIQDGGEQETEIWGPVLDPQYLKAVRGVQRLGTCNTCRVPDVPECG